ncbi:ADP-ribosylglycohydrolase family protein [Streptomyces phaeolivaceus]|uniref:ADP-ribosylglycohydrolase family protein n=1 Tax=Streptomyces phaeolivaceus TaxID=2653200 RepID=A0A5P8JZW9_9ACTN|nr:ADP-ribosylglycohydrolase family protein [Streptomyces phaeolivaceus]QFQ96563.1 ADP-ribosylglycohydrolase family protein [Streptomyces phaeolivaceus]
MTPLRLTWVQPEDLLGHELHQARQDGREPAAVAARWHAAGGPPAPLRAGASPHPASRYLRQLAEDLLDELADLPSALTEHEPTDLARIKARCPNWPTPAHSAPTRATPATYVRRLESAWLGRAAGCLLGKPVEKLPLPAIRQLAAVTSNWPLTTWFTARGVPQDLLTAHPWNRRSAPTSLAENIDGMPEDDDLNYPLLNLLLLSRHGRDFTTTDVATLWLDELPAGRTFTAERVAYRNLLTGIDPPHTARHRNPFREWIGALIRADVHGWTNPGDPAAAAEQAHRDATLTHTANGVYAAMFVAATIAEAAAAPEHGTDAGTGTGTHDIHHCLRTGLTVVPPNSRLAKAITHALRLATGHRDFDTVVDALHSVYADHHWVHAIPNTALLTAALTHADGDFTASICRAVSGGWDTDSNGATAGSIAGLLTGSPDALPDRWTAPLKNRLATSIADFNGVGFDTLAHLTLRETPHP